MSSTAVSVQLTHPSTQDSLSVHTAKLALDLLYAVDDFYEEDDFEDALQKISSEAKAKGIKLKQIVNLVGIPGYYAEPTEVCPLVLAIQAGNAHAALKLISAGASVEQARLADRSRSHIIFTAVAKGLDTVVQEMITKAPSLLQYIFKSSGNTLLHRAVTAFAGYPIVFKGKWNTKDLQTQMIQYYNESELRENLPQPLSVDYKGNFNIIALLVAHAPWMVSVPNKHGLTPYDLAQHPIKYKAEFADGFCLDSQELEPSKASFQIKLSNRVGDDEKQVPVIVHCDFTEVCETLNRASQNRHVTQVAQQVATVQTDLQQTKVMLEDHDAHVQAQRREIEKELALKAWLEEPGNENLKQFYRLVFISMENLFDGVGVVASKEVDPSAGDLHKGAVGLHVIGELAGATIVGAPVDKICNALAALTDAADDRRQINKATHAAHLGTKAEKAACCKEVAKALTERLEEPLLTLLTTKEVQKQQKSSTKILQKIQGGILDSTDFSPAERVGLFAYTLICDEIHQARKIDKTRPLSEVLISAVLEGKPSEGVMATLQSLLSTKVPIWDEGTVVSVSPSEIVAKAKRDRAPSDSSSSSGISSSGSGHSDSSSVDSTQHLGVSLAEKTRALTESTAEDFQLPPRQASIQVTRPGTFTPLANAVAATPQASVQAEKKSPLIKRIFRIT